MRPGMLLTLTLSWLALHACTAPLAAKTTRVNAANGKVNDVPVLKVEGRWHSTENDAWQSAERETHVVLTDYFREEGMVFHKPATMQDLRPLLAKQWKFTPESKIFPDGVGMMHRIVLEVPVTPEVRKFLIERERDARVQERMFGLGKLLAILVVVLTAATGYLRLDEWTKGYFTTYLVLGVVSAVGISLVLLFLA